MIIFVSLCSLLMSITVALPSNSHRAVPPGEADQARGENSDTLRSRLATLPIFKEEAIQAQIHGSKYMEL